MHVQDTGLQKVKWLGSLPTRMKTQLVSQMSVSTPDPSKQYRAILYDRASTQKLVKDSAPIGSEQEKY